MHVPDHTDILPEYVDPIPIPDTREEAAFLRLLLDLEFYPHCEALDVSTEGETEGEACIS